MTIQVRLVVDSAFVITGSVSGADSPNDFWTTFKSQLIRIENATEQLPNGQTFEHDTLYVNRDKIVLASVEKS